MITQILPIKLSAAARFYSGSNSNANLLNWHPLLPTPTQATNNAACGKHARSVENREHAVPAIMIGLL